MGEGGRGEREGAGEIAMYTFQTYFFVEVSISPKHIPASVMFFQHQ